VNAYPPGHFYSPIPDLLDLNTERADVNKQKLTLLPGMEINDHGQMELLSAFSAFYEDMPIPERKSSSFRSYLDNDYFSYGDSVILYSFLRYFQPKKIIEVGSGFSSALMLDVCELFNLVDTQLTFIDPFTERLDNLLKPEDRNKIVIIDKKIQDIGIDIFSKLDTGDILFIDSSHVAKRSSDLLHIIFKILPIIKVGVLIHFHDIPWPFEYPVRWLRAGRAWNEVYFLRALLQGSRDFEIVYFNSYMEQIHADLLREAMPLVLKTPSFPLTIGNSSLWLRARGVEK